MASLTPPRAPQKPVVRSHHGDDVVDAYEWLRDKEDPEVIAHLEAENAYTDEQTDHLAALRESDLRGDQGPHAGDRPLRARPRGPVVVLLAHRGGQQYGVHCRAPIAGPDDWTPPRRSPATPRRGRAGAARRQRRGRGARLLLARHLRRLADGTLPGLRPSTRGDERYTAARPRPRDRRDLADRRRTPSPAPLFDPTGDCIFYPTVDDAWRPDTIWRHRVGTRGATTSSC